MIGDRLGTVAAGRHGAVEATAVDLTTGAVTRARLSGTPVEKEGRCDDHDAAGRPLGLGRRVVVRPEPLVADELHQPAPSRRRARPHLQLLPWSRQPLQAVGRLVGRRRPELDERGGRDRRPRGVPAPALRQVRLRREGHARLRRRPGELRRPPARPGWCRSATASRGGRARRGRTARSPSREAGCTRARTTTRAAWPWYRTTRRARWWACGRRARRAAPWAGPGQASLGRGHRQVDGGGPSRRTMARDRTAATAAWALTARAARGYKGRP